jgi:hypothetical protein
MLFGAQKNKKKKKVLLLLPRKNSKNPSILLSEGMVPPVLIRE